MRIIGTKRSYFSQHLTRLAVESQAMLPSADQPLVREILEIAAELLTRGELKRVNPVVTEITRRTACVRQDPETKRRRNKIRQALLHLRREAERESDDPEIRFLVNLIKKLTPLLCVHRERTTLGAGGVRIPHLEFFCLRLRERREEMLAQSALSPVPSAA